MTQEQLDEAMQRLYNEAANRETSVPEYMSRLIIHANEKIAWLEERAKTMENKVEQLLPNLR